MHLGKDYTLKKKCVAKNHSLFKPEPVIFVMFMSSAQGMQILSLLSRKSPCDFLSREQNGFAGKLRP